MATKTPVFGITPKAEQAASTAAGSSKIQGINPKTGNPYHFESDLYTPITWKGSTTLRNGRTYDISRRVYQRNDIDWKSSQFRDKYGRTNLDRVKDGDPPLSSDGQSIQLHHVIGKEPGAMAEIPRSVHQKYSKQLHGIIEKSFRRNPTLNEMYNNYRQQYWRWRAEQVERKLK
ncbi:HNH/ENDO VII family nuclease [Melghirimyces thermohalophilus]|uniref:HNH/ENDO VII family nuclease n=1 Tax=Melghirimyces thermohalophilus TaxID=1236220 RepID=UPI0015A47FD0|nr:HNH/ENDO VII family nuclease [Melghirimyces thermohalophilus]